jgi:hypothetical protein
MTDDLSRARGDAELADEIDKWCRRKCAGLSEVMEPFICSGGSLSDPQYRQQLGEHQAYMRVRSFISRHRSITEGRTT